MNRYILVTGALGGMGRAVTELLMREGYSVIALDRKAGESGKNFFPIEADVTSEDSILAAYKKVKDITNEIGFTTDMKAYKADPTAFPGTVADVSTFVRQAVTGKTNSPDLYTVMQILGYERTVERIRKVMNQL